MSRKRLGDRSQHGHIVIRVKHAALKLVRGKPVFGDQISRVGDHLFGRFFAAGVGLFVFVSVEKI